MSEGIQGLHQLAVSDRNNHSSGAERLNATKWKNLPELRVLCRGRLDWRVWDVRLVILGRHDSCLHYRSIESPAADKGQEVCESTFVPRRDKSVICREGYIYSTSPFPSSLLPVNHHQERQGTTSRIAFDSLSNPKPSSSTLASLPRFPASSSPAYPYPQSEHPINLAYLPTIEHTPT